MRDLTKDYEYEKLIEEEKTHYSQIEVTEDLREGGTHASSCWHYYWERVGKVVQPSDFADMAGYLSRTFAGLGRPIEVLSLGSGYCGNELALARAMHCGYRIRCTDINEGLFERAKAAVRDERLTVEFTAADLNFIAIDPGRYDLILAHAVLHHVINLEHLFGQIASGLSDQGIFHLVDVAGKNRKLIWDPNERFVNALLDLLPKHFTRGERVAVVEGADGMEGVRQEEIVPQLRTSFSALFEYSHGAFMRFICTSSRLGPLFDPRNAEARRYLDFLIESDECSVRRGILRPLEIWGVYRPEARPPEAE